jgi:hypothetical protein
MLKKAFIALLIASAFSACSSDKAQEKALTDSVVSMHDKMMAADEAIMKDKMKLDALAAKDPSPAVKDSVAAYKKLLGDADDAMMGWMNSFNPDQAGKSHADIMDYLGKQKQQIIKIKSQMDKAIDQSGRYIAKANGK